MIPAFDAIRVLAWRITRLFFSSWKGLVISIVSPLCMLVFLGPTIGINVQTVEVLGNHVGYISFFLPGVMTISLFYGAMFTAGNAIVGDRVTGFCDTIRTSPNAGIVIISGHVLGSVLIGGVQALLFFLIGLVYMPVLSFSPISILAIALVLVGACFFGVLGTLLGARVSFSNFSLAFTLASIPLVYASTIFVPAMDFPEGLRWLVLLNPVSIVVDLLRSAMLGVSSWPGLPGGLPAAVLVDGVLLAVYSAAILLLALSLHDRFPRGKSPMKKGNAARDDGELATEISNLVANIVGKEKLAELLPLVQQGRIDELLKQFPRETVEKLLDLVRETINKHVPATNK